MKETDPEFESADAVMTVNEAENGKMVVSEAGEVFGVSERQGHPGSAFFTLRIVVRAFRQKIVFSAILVENLKI